MSKDVVPQGFTLKLALVDALPVLFFGLGTVSAGILLKSRWFLLGAALCTLAGGVKVLWKVFVALLGKNIWWMFVQMRILMPVGFVGMVVGLIANDGGIDRGTLLALALQWPSIGCFAASIAGMIAMGVCAAKLDSGDVRSNWIEQAINSAAQLCFCLGVLAMLQAV